jgi:hypothetical protein
MKFAHKAISRQRVAQNQDSPEGLSCIAAFRLTKYPFCCIIVLLSVESKENRYAKWEDVLLPVVGNNKSE